MVEINPGRPSVSSVVISSSCPLVRGSAPFSIRPVLILGPCRSARIATCRPNDPDSRRIVVMISFLTSLEPCEKLSRNRSTPARISRSIMAGEELAGPRVAIILVLREGMIISLRRVSVSVVKATFPLPVLTVGCPVALETGLLLHLAQVEG